MDRVQQLSYDFVVRTKTRGDKTFCRHSVGGGGVLLSAATYIEKDTQSKMVSSDKDSNWKTIEKMFNERTCSFALERLPESIYRIGQDERKVSIRRVTPPPINDQSFLV